MNYKIPKFLERETKFFSFFTFKQLAVIGCIGLALFVLYYIIPRTAFYLLAFFTAIIVLTFTFIRVEGFTLTQIVVQFFGYFIASKKYFWQKKEIMVAPKFRELKEEKKPVKQEPLRLSPESRIKKLNSQVEMGIR